MINNSTALARSYCTVKVNQESLCSYLEFKVIVVRIASFLMSMTLYPLLVGLTPLPNFKFDTQSMYKFWKSMETKDDLAMYLSAVRACHQ